MQGNDSSTDSQRKTEEQRLRAYIDLMQQLYRQYHDRRDLEWRVHILIWTLLVLIAYASISTEFQLGCIAGIIFLFLPLHLFWLAKIVRGEVSDYHRSMIYRDRAEKIIEFEMPSDEDLKKYLEKEGRSQLPNWIAKNFESYYWWLAVVMSTTFILTLVDFILLSGFKFPIKFLLIFIDY